MHIDPYILAFSALTVISTIWMGFWAARKSKTAHDFFVAGRNVSVGWNASAISGEYLSAASFMGVAGMVMSSGYDALWYPVCYACGYLFLLLFIAGPLRRFGAYTIPDFAEGRYDSPIFRKIAVVFVLFIGFFYTMPQMKGAGTTLAYIFPGLPYWAGVVLVGAVITLNVALGGMKGITLVQAFQYWAKMFAISVPIFVLMAVYGHYGKQLEQNLPVQLKFERLYRPPAKLQTMIREQVGDKAADVARLDNPDYAGFRMPDGKLSLGGLLKNYGLFQGKAVYVAAPMQNLRTLVSFTTNHVNRTNYFEIANPLIAANGFKIVQEDGSTVRFVASGASTETGTVIRKALPTKAPPDSTWLSPFGPLTTKAAKAAAAALTNSTDFSSKIPLRADLSPNQKLTASFDVTNLTPQAFQIYAELTGRKQLPLPSIKERAGEFFGALHRKWTGRPRVWTALVSYHADGLYSASEVKDRLENLFKSNGVRVAAEGEQYFRAVKMSTPGTSDAEAMAALQKSWLQTHERPLALLYTYSLIIALVCGTAGLPHILVRFYTNPDGVAAKRTTMWVMILIGVFYVFPPVFGVMGRNLMPELYTGLAGIKGTDQVVLKLPILLNERVPYLGSVLSGITCAGAFAAFMSTFSGLLVSMTGALAHDVYGRIFRPKSTPEQRLRMFKFAAVLIGGVAVALGSFVEPLEINFMVGQAFAIAAASYFPLLFMSVWWRGMTTRGAAAGMLTGGLCALAGATLTNVSNLALDKGPMGKIFAGFAPLNDFWAAHPLLRILCEQPAIWAVPLAIVLMIVVSKLTRNQVPSDIRMKMLVLHAPEKLGLKQEYIAEHQAVSH